jgi:hypothetical protein
MSNQFILPIEQIISPSTGKPVFNARLFFGRQDATDLATNPASRVPVFFVDGSGAEIPLAQPVRTNAAGNPVNAQGGSPVQIRIKINPADSGYSFLAQTDGGAQVLYQARVGYFSIANQVLTMQGLLDVTPSDGLQVNVACYHNIATMTNATYVWDAARPKSAHNGGAIIDPTAIYPTDWNNETQLNSWYNSANSGSGCWVLTETDAVYAAQFGALPSLNNNRLPLLKAIKYAESLSSSTMLPGTFQASANTVPVYVSGFLKVTGESIPLFSRLYLESIGKTVIYSTNGNRVDTLFTSTNLWKLNVKGITFVNYNKVFNTSTSNIGGAVWTFDHVIAQRVNVFVDSGSYATSRSTFVTFNNCESTYEVNTFARLFCDQVNFNDCWMLHASQSALIYGNSNFSLNNCILEPIDAGLGKCFVYLTDDNGAGGVWIDSNRSVNIEGGRISNEGGGCPIVVADYGVSSAVAPVIGPIVAISNVAMAGFKNSKFRADDTETGTVYLLKYPQAVYFSSVSFGDLGDTTSKLIAKSVSLTSTPPAWFNVQMDDTTAQIALQSADSYNATSSIAGSLANWVMNPQPMVFGGLREFGYVPIVPTATTGRRKGTFTIKTGWSGSNPATFPNIFYLVLAGNGQTNVESSQQYTGSAVYVVSVNGFTTGEPSNKVSFTKLHSESFGSNNQANAEIVSMHFGTGDTGPAEIATAAELSISFTFGANMAIGQARIVPMNTVSNVLKLKRFG